MTDIIVTDDAFFRPSVTPVAVAHRPDAFVKCGIFSQQQSRCACDRTRLGNRNKEYDRLIQFIQPGTIYVGSTADQST
jgi:hypothetical protein